MMGCVQDGSLDDAVRHCKKIPFHSNRQYILLGDIAEKFLLMCIACHGAVILKAILLLFLCEHFTL
jgi:hypothetical protein